MWPTKAIITAAMLLLSVSDASATMWTVTRLVDTDDGVCDTHCSLREAIDVASPGDSIVFMGPIVSPLTITLTRGPLLINKDLVIWGPGAAWLTVDGNGAQHVFDVTASATATLSGLTIRGATGTSTASGVVNRGHLTIEACTITGNNLGIHNYLGEGGLFIESSTITENSGGHVAGGIVNSGDLTMVNSTVSYNTSDANSVVGGGGGIHSGGYGGQGTLTVVNSTISGNAQITSAASTNAGGIFSSSLETTLTHVTIANNSATGADSAGGILVSGNGALGAVVTVRNTIVANNVDNAWVPDVAVHATYGGLFDSDGYNLIGNAGSVTAFTQAGDQAGGSFGSSIDALLDPLDDYSGPTATHRLRGGSPAIDAGESFGYTVDQRGVTRPRDGATPNAPGGDGSDIGAYETTVFAVIVGKISFIDRYPPNIRVVWRSLDGGGEGGIVRTNKTGEFRIDRIPRNTTIEIRVRHPWVDRAPQVVNVGQRDVVTVTFDARR